MIKIVVKRHVTIDDAIRDNLHHNVGKCLRELIGDIFQAGMAVGIFIVIAVIVLIIWLISKFRK